MAPPPPIQIPKIPVLAGLTGLALTQGCTERAVKNSDAVEGKWNLVLQTYNYDGRVYSRPMPVLVEDSWYGQTYCYGYALDLELRDGGVGSITYAGVYGEGLSCAQSLQQGESYAGEEVVEWEVLSDGRIGVFQDYTAWGSGSDYGEFGVTTAYTSSTDGGYVPDTGGTEADGGPPAPERRLILVCTTDEASLRCTMPESNLEAWNFARPACSSNSDCDAGEFCFGSQCVAPTDDPYGGYGDAPPRPRAVAKRHRIKAPHRR